MKDLVLQSLKAHEDYTLSRIDSPQNQIYYVEMMVDVQKFVQSYDNYFVPVLALATSFEQLREPSFSFNQEIKYKKLALTQAVDVIVCINKRFGQ